MLPFFFVAFSRTTLVLAGLARLSRIFVVLACLAWGSASAQNGRSAGAQAPAARHALSEHVTHPYSAQSSYGEYQYLPQQGLYKDVTMGERVEDFNRAFHNAGSALDRLNHYTGWTMYGGTGDWTYTARAGIGGFALPGFGLGWGSSYTHSQGYFKIAAGPLLLDNFYAGLGAIYTDINGPMPGRELLPPDDRWSMMVWLSFRASLVLSDSIAVSIQPFLYWLPLKGEVGWGIPGPYAGMFLPQLGTVSLLQIAWAKEVGNWRLTAYDQFSPMLAPYNIWDVFLNANIAWGDLSPIERVGRYGFGYGASDVTNYDPQARFGLRNDDWDGVGGYYNLAGFRAYGKHGYQTQSLFYFDRVDFWDKNFNDTYSAILGGAYLRTGDQYFSTYAGYNFASAEPFNNFLHWAVVGAQKQLTPALRAYVQGGYFWQTGEDGDQGWLGLVGLQQRLGLRTSHGVEVGRRVYRPLASAPGIEDYIEYRLLHQIGSRASLSAFAGMSERTVKANMESDYVVKYAGTMLSTQISQRISSFATAGWERVEIESGDLLMIDRWTYRLGLMYTVTQDIQSHCFYQYEDLHGSINYSEHYLYLGVSKRF